MDVHVKSIVNIYIKYIIDDINWYDPHVKYDILFFMQYLISIDCEKFQEEFGVYDDNDIKLLLKCLDTTEQRTVDQLDMLTAIKRHLEYSDTGIKIDFRSQFDKISDNFLSSIFNDIEHRLQGLLINHNYLITRRASDGYI